MSTITLNAAPFQTISELPAVGSKAPAFMLTRDNLGDISLENCLGKIVVLNIFPSLDTPTCAMAMKRFNEIAAKQDNLMVLCVSADLPFAQKRFCSMEHLNNVLPVSTFRHSDFGKIYGVQIIDGPLAGLLARAVILIDEKGHIVYTQLVHEISHEPDYDDLLKHIVS